MSHTRTMKYNFIHIYVSGNHKYICHMNVGKVPPGEELKTKHERIQLEIAKRMWFNPQDIIEFSKKVAYTDENNKKVYMQKFNFNKRDWTYLCLRIENGLKSPSQLREGRLLFSYVIKDERINTLGMSGGLFLSNNIYYRITSEQTTGGGPPVYRLELSVPTDVTAPGIPPPPYQPPS